MKKERLYHGQIRFVLVLDQVHVLIKSSIYGYEGVVMDQGSVASSQLERGKAAAIPTLER